MNPYVADPGWHGLIIWYFYLGGIAAGAYAVAALVGLCGNEDDRRAARLADYLALPLVAICGLLLTIDLGRPERFWHMLIASETGWPMFKWWSPMSAGSWGLSLFGLFSGLSFLAVLIEDGWIGRPGWAGPVTRLRRSWPGRLFNLGGAGSAFFLGSYTGVLLSATNQPAWSETTWLGALFLASAVSTGVAAIVVLARWRGRDLPEAVLERMERVDTSAMFLELGLLLAFALSLGRLAWPALGRWPGLLLPVVVVPFGLLLPLALRLKGGVRAASPSALLVLVGGFALRAAVVGIPPSLIR